MRLHQKINNRFIFDVRNGKDIDGMVLKIDATNDFDERTGLNDFNDDEL